MERLEPILDEREISIFPLFSLESRPQLRPTPSIFRQLLNHEQRGQASGSLSDATRRSAIGKRCWN